MEQSCNKIGHFVCHFLFSDDLRDLNKLKKLGLIEVLKTNLLKLENLLNFNWDIDLLVLEEKSLVIKEYGVSGFTLRKNLMYVYLDPTFKNIEQTIRKYIPMTLAHECHHAARWASVGYGETLLEELVTGGTALAFEIEYTKTIPIYAEPLTKSQERRMWKKAKPLLNKKNHNHSAWFFGNKEIPRHTGYHLGYKLVKNYLENHPRLKAKNLVGLKAQEFLSANL